MWPSAVLTIRFSCSYCTLHFAHSTMAGHTIGLQLFFHSRASKRLSKCLVLKQHKAIWNTRGLSDKQEGYARCAGLYVDNHCLILRHNHLL